MLQTAQGSAAPQSPQKHTSLYMKARDYSAALNLPKAPFTVKQSLNDLSSKCKQEPALCFLCISNKSEKCHTCTIFKEKSVCKVSPDMRYRYYFPLSLVSILSYKSESCLLNINMQPWVWFHSSNGDCHSRWAVQESGTQNNMHLCTQC